MKILLVSVFVSDPIAAFKFYTQILGFQEHTFMPEANLAVVVSAEDPEGTALLLEPNSSTIAKQYQEGLMQAGLPVIIFSTDNIEKEVERLKGCGVIFRKDPVKTDYGIEAVLEDSFGNLVQIMEQ